VGNNEQALKERATIHLAGTGFRWNEEANLYLADHRLGYPNTDGFLAFFDFNNLEEGDRVFVTDADGTKHTYRTFRRFVVKPGDLSVTEPTKGKDIVTL
jgi:sortase A